MKHELHLHPLFAAQGRPEFMSYDERISLTYQRIKLLLQTHNLKPEDVQFCTPKFWALMTDPICMLDGAIFVMLTCHLSLVIGTLSRQLAKRPDLRPLVESLLRFDTFGIFLVTERAHGLDAVNLETTATKTSDGFILHTPREEAAKFMPASTPHFGVEKVALVFARLIVDGEDRGARFFIVPICNKREMYRGVSSIRLPPRGGSSPHDDAITTFDHVYLPPTALVAPDITDLSAPSNLVEKWWDEAWRIQLGPAVISCYCIPALKVTAFIGGTYSLHRPASGNKPIIIFRTQQWAVLHAIAVATVMDVWFHWIVDMMSKAPNFQVRNALAVIFKATVCRHFQRVITEVAERCGAQGTISHTSFVRMEMDVRGGIIAEGDLLSTSIRLFSQLVQRQLSLGSLIPDSKDSLLAKHASAVLEENCEIMKSAGKNGPKTFNALVMSQSEPSIEALGHAMAYSVAVKAKLPQPIIAVYECAVIRQDPAWYVECAGISRMDQRHRVDAAISSALPHIKTYLEQLNIAKYVSSPLVSDADWKDYVNNLPVSKGNAVPDFGNAAKL